MIRFNCQCGRTLKAPERLSGKNARCPACGASCSVPSPATAGAERGVGVDLQNVELKAESNFLPTADSDRSSRRLPVHTYISNEESSPEDNGSEYALGPISAPDWVVAGPPRPDPNYKRTAFFEPHPTDDWLGPSIKRKYFSRLAGLQAVVTTIIAISYPYVLDNGFSWMNGVFFEFVATAALGLLMGYGCLLLNLVLTSAMRGSDSESDLPHPDLSSAMTCFARWSISFLCGPAVLLGLAFYYGIHCGDVALPDVLIVIELTVPAMTYWVIGLLVLAKHPERICPSPRLVLQEIRRLGRRALLAGIFATIGLLFFVGIGTFALAGMHESWLVGATLFAIGWFAAWSVAGYGLQTLGGWHRKSLKSRPQTVTCRATA